MFLSTRLQMVLLTTLLVSASTIGWATEPTSGPKRTLPPGQKTDAARENTEAAAQLTPAKTNAESASQKMKKPAVSLEKKVIELAADQTQMRSTKMLDEIIEGIMEGDYNKYARNLSPEMRKFQTRQIFLQLQQKMQKNLGKLQTLTYLGFYDQLGKRLALFKARFEKEKDDALITVVLENKDKEPKVGGLWFDAPALEKR